MRYAIRRTQRELDQERKYRDSYPNALVTLSYRELQALATERGINARQSADALRKALSE